MIKKLTSMLLVSATAALLSSYRTIQQDGNMKCETIRNGVLFEMIFSYNRSKQLVTFVELGQSGVSQVANVTSKASEINGIVRWPLAELGASFKLDKSKMRLVMSKMHKGKSYSTAMACRWI
jgi:hypothetical protein